MSRTMPSGTRSPLSRKPLDLLAQIGLPRDMVTQQVTGRDMRDTKVLGDEPTLGALAGTWSSEHQHAQSQLLGTREDQIIRRRTSRGITLPQLSPSRGAYAPDGENSREWLVIGLGDDVCGFRLFPRWNPPA